MRLMLWVAAATLTAAPFMGASASQNQVPTQAGNPGPVAAWLAKARQDCPGGYQEQPGVVQSFDLTGAGAPGWIVDPHRLVCAMEPHLFVGDGPASIELFVTLPNGQIVHTGGVVALSYQVLPSPSGGPPTIAFVTHQEGERAGSVDTYRWDGRNFAVIDRRPMARPPAD